MSTRISFLKVFTVVIVALLSILVLSLNHTLRVPSIFDGKLYTQLEIKKAQKPFIIPEAAIDLPPLTDWADSSIAQQYGYIDLLLKNSNTTSFLVLRNDTLVFKRYLNGVKEGEVTQLFSVTKVFVTAMAGIALNDKHFESVEDPVTKYLKKLPEKGFNKLTLLQLMQMQSGLNYDEYGQWYKTLAFYYEPNLTNAIQHAKFVKQPGTEYKYKSIDTQILGECINAAIGKNKKITDFFYDEIWNKIGAQDSASWSLDSKIHRSPKYYGGLNMSARDLAKFGMMVAHNGKFKNKQVLPKNWFHYCDDPLHRSSEEEKYCMGWYYAHDDDSSNVYYAAGFGGQIMMINETKNVIVIRLGTDRGGVSWYAMMKKLSEII